MIVKITKNWKYAHEGVRVVEYEPGVVDLPEVVAERAIEDGCAEKASASEKREELKDQKDEAKADAAADKQAIASHHASQDAEAVAAAKAERKK